mmetsp:Transcript_18541/g.44452  ORF Transcript_18541/g.44452 Transcript_18541/m.44452 type:complete len:171 (+) Transcript_18541:386-898(+)
MSSGLVVGSVALGLPLEGRPQPLMTSMPTEGDRQSSLLRRKESHNQTEQRRRQRINDKIMEIKEMVPRCQNASVDKATILAEAIDYVRRLQQDNTELQQRHQHLEYEKSQLLDEQSKLAKANPAAAAQVQAAAAHRVQSRAQVPNTQPGGQQWTGVVHNYLAVPARSQNP